MRVGMLRAGAIYALGNVLAAGVPFLLLPILTRALEPEQYGEVVAFFLLASVASSIAGLNVHGCVSVRWFDRQQSDFNRFVGTALIVAIVSTAMATSAFLAAGLIWHDRMGLPAMQWAMAALLAGASTIGHIRTTLWQSQRRPVPSAAFQVSGAALNMALSMLGVLVLSLQALGRNGGATAAALIAAVAAVILLTRDGRAWAWNVDDARRLLRFGVPLIPHALAGAALATADRFAVSAQLGTEVLGVYGAAAQLGMIMIVLSDAASKALSPWIYAQLSNASATGRLRVVGTAYAMVPIWLITAFAVWIVLLACAPWLLGVRFQAAAQLSIWFLLGGAMTAIYVNVAGLFFFTSRSEWLSLATLCTGTIAILLAPLLVERFGVSGAAIAYLCAQFTQLTLSWLVSLRVQPMPWHRPGLALRVLRNSLMSR